MVTQQDLQRWKEAKNLAITSLNVETSILIALQEMYIELKELRRHNLKLLNTDTLVEMLTAYVRDSREKHYLDDEMEDMISDIERWIETHNLDLEV